MQKVLCRISSLLLSDLEVRLFSVIITEKPQDTNISNFRTVLTKDERAIFNPNTSVTEDIGGHVPSMMHVQSSENE